MAYPECLPTLLNNTRLPDVRCNYKVPARTYSVSLKILQHSSANSASRLADSTQLQTFLQPTGEQTQPIRDSLQLPDYS
jgi:hypothetical protein